MTATETAAQCIDCLLAWHAARNPNPPAPKRIERVVAALEAGVSDADAKLLIEAKRISQTDMITLPFGRHERCARSRGWARQGTNKIAWGKKNDAGYRVGAGMWSVGSSDGFDRKSAVTWTVTHVKVGGEVWTVAN